MHSILVPRIESAANMPPSPAGDSNHGFARISVLLGSHSEAFRPPLTLTLSQRERECMAWITTVRDSRPLPKGEGMHGLDHHRPGLTPTPKGRGNAWLGSLPSGTHAHSQGERGFGGRLPSINSKRSAGYPEKKYAVSGRTRIPEGTRHQTGKE